MYSCFAFIVVIAYFRSLAASKRINIYKITSHETAANGSPSVIPIIIYTDYKARMRSHVCYMRIAYLRSLSSATCTIHTSFFLRLV